MNAENYFERLVMNYHYKRELIKFTKEVTLFLATIDKIYKAKECYQRGKQIAKCINFLDISNDSVMHSVLNYSFKKIAQLKKEAMLDKTNNSTNQNSLFKKTTQ